MTALVNAPAMLGPVRQLYRSLFDSLGSGSEKVEEIRHALLAVEGAFLLAGLGFAEISSEELRSVLLHARKKVLATLDKPAPRR